MSPKQILEEIEQYPQTQKSLLKKLGTGNRNTEYIKLKKRLNSLLKSGQIQKKIFVVDKRPQAVYVSENLYKVIFYQTQYPEYDNSICEGMKTSEFLICYKSENCKRLTPDWIEINEAHIFIRDDWKKFDNLMLSTDYISGIF